jgi:hypothetical protein
VRVQTSPAAALARARVRPPAPARDPRTVSDENLRQLIFLVVTRATSVLGLSRREARWKDAAILMLRHQLAGALRERPRAHSRLTWPDRAWLALLAGTLPANRLAAMRLIVTPATILRGIAASCAAAGRECRAAGASADYGGLRPMTVLWSTLTNSSCSVSSRCAPQSAAGVQPSDRTAGRRT